MKDVNADIDAHPFEASEPEQGPRFCGTPGGAPPGRHRAHNALRGANRAYRGASLSVVI